MEQINKRIAELKRIIAVLRSYRAKGDFSKFKESEIITSICEYTEELEQLEQIKKENASLFRLFM